MVCVSSSAGSGRGCADRGRALAPATPHRPSCGKVALIYGEPAVHVLQSQLTPVHPPGLRLTGTSSREPSLMPTAPHSVRPLLVLLSCWLVCPLPHSTEHTLGPMSSRSHQWPLVPSTLLAML